MRSVREATFDLFRAHGTTTMLGKPGLTDLPMLADLPEDISYVLGLQELVVVGMADGYAQASGCPTRVNLQTAPGVGNAVSGIFSAQADKSPLVITAGQQVRAHVAMKANLTNHDATLGSRPHVKWSNERPCLPGRRQPAAAPTRDVRESGGDARRAQRRALRSRALSWTRHRLRRNTHS
jgi:benzoylformate decarboxylase